MQGQKQGWTFLRFLYYFDELKPQFKADMLRAMRWGMWLGGIITFAIFAILRALRYI